MEDKDMIFANMKKAKEKEVISHLQAAKWEQMQLEETRSLLTLAYTARGLQGLSNMYASYQALKKSRVTRCWTEAVWETKLENALKTGSQQRSSTNIKAGFVGLASIFDQMVFRRLCVGFYTWCGIMPAPIEELTHLPIKPYKGVGTRASTIPTMASSAKYRTFNSPSLTVIEDYGQEEGGNTETSPVSNVRRGASQTKPRTRRASQSYAVEEQEYHQEDPKAPVSKPTPSLSGSKGDIYQRALGLLPKAREYH